MEEIELLLKYLDEKNMILSTISAPPLRMCGYEILNLEGLTVNCSGRRFSSERNCRRNAAMLLYSVNRMKQTQAVNTYASTRCAHSLCNAHDKV